MKKDLGVIAGVFPMPVLIVAAYDEDGKANAMNVAWGQICDMDKIILFLDEDHKTTKNILISKAFTVALADEKNMVMADYVGIVSGNDVGDKFESTGYHAEKSSRVNAPIITEYPVTLECELLEKVNTEYVNGIVGKIVNVIADEEVLTDKNKVDVKKLNAIMFDQFQAGYYSVGEKVGQAWVEGKEMMKK